MICKISHIRKRKAIRYLLFLSLTVELYKVPLKAVIALGTIMTRSVKEEKFMLLLLLGAMLLPACQ